MADQNLDAAGNPMERVEKAGRRGWRFVDGAILWDDGEKEVPVSGLSDAEKRAEAMRAALGEPPQLKSGPSQAEIDALQAQTRDLRNPSAVLRERKAYAKRKAGEKPAEGRGEAEKALEDAPKSLEERTHDARKTARALLDAEIDRCEELKTLATGGGLILLHQNAVAPWPNPPMRLHETILLALRAIDSGNPIDMLEALGELRAWTGTFEVPQPRSDPVDTPTKGTGVRYEGGSPATPGLDFPGPEVIPPAPGGLSGPSGTQGEDPGGSAPPA